MKLMTKELHRKLPPLYSTESQQDPIVQVKFFTPWSNWTWYATEGSYVDADGVCDAPGGAEAADFLFFGLVEGFEKEMGYFSLKEITAVRGPGGLGIERDLYWKPVPLSQIYS